MFGFRRLQTQAQPKRFISSWLAKNVWGKSNAMYVTYIFAGCVAIEFVYGGVTNALWDINNSGV